MTKEMAVMLLTVVGVLQLSVLIASSLVPLRLNWREELTVLTGLHRQLYWVYGGYVVLAIVSLGLITTFNARELASGSGLARSFCAFAAAFWGIRLSLQPFLDVKQHLTTWWLRWGYHTLTVLFLTFTAVFGYMTVHALGK
jgi:hypothetical protein